LNGLEETLLVWVVRPCWSGWFRGDLAGRGGFEETLLVGWFRGDLAGLGCFVEALLAWQFRGGLAGLGVIGEASLVWVVCVVALLAV